MFNFNGHNVIIHTGGSHDDSTGGIIGALVGGICGVIVLIVVIVIVIYCCWCRKEKKRKSLFLFLGTKGIGRGFQRFQETPL